MGDVRVEATRAFLLLRRGIFHKWIVTSIRDVVSVGRKKGSPRGLVGAGRGPEGVGEYQCEVAVEGGKKMYNENTRAYNSRESRPRNPVRAPLGTR